MGMLQERVMFKPRRYPAVSDRSSIEADARHPIAGA
jgi:hypothetical protein